MAISDAQGNLHATDGKFTHKPAKVGAGANNMLSAPGASSLRFEPTGPQSIKVNLPDTNMFKLSEFPVGVPEPEIEFGYSDEGAVYMSATNPESGDCLIVQAWEPGQLPEVRGSDYLGDASEEKLAELENWAGEVFMRGQEALNQCTAQTTSNLLLSQIADFSVGNEPNDEDGKTYQDRYADRMQHALSGYLSAGDGEGLSDVLTNLRHWAEREGVDFDEAVASSLDGKHADDEEDSRR